MNYSQITEQEPKKTIQDYTASNLSTRNFNPSLANLRIFALLHIYRVNTNLVLVPVPYSYQEATALLKCSELNM